MAVIYTDTASFKLSGAHYRRITDTMTLVKWAFKFHCQASIHIHDLEVDRVLQINEDADSIISTQLPAVQSWYASTTLPLRLGCKPIQLEEASKISREQSFQVAYALHDADLAWGKKQWVIVSTNYSWRWEITMPNGASGDFVIPLYESTHHNMQVEQSSKSTRTSISSFACLMDYRNNV